MKGTVDYFLNGFCTTLICLMLISCKKDLAEPQCSKNFAAKLLPDNNPVAAPVLIKGKGFSPRTKVYFNKQEAEVSIINDSTITTHVPGEIQDFFGNTEVVIKDQTCENSYPFRVSKGFEDNKRVSPPNVFIPSKNEKISFDFFKYFKLDYTGSGYSPTLSNLWSYTHYLYFSKIAINGSNKNIVDFTGIENIIASSSERNNFKGKYSLTDQNIEITISRSPTAILPEEKLVGAFYTTNIVSPDGNTKETILFLESKNNNRQFIFRVRL